MGLEGVDQHWSRVESKVGDDTGQETSMSRSRGTGVGRDYRRSWRSTSVSSLDLHVPGNGLPSTLVPFQKWGGPFSSVEDLGKESRGTKGGDGRRGTRTEDEGP